jgi:cytidylate kinase
LTQKLKIAFSGLTAAGKTTHSMLLADELGARWLGATQMLVSLAGVDHPPDEGLWASEVGRAIERAREGDELDRRLDALLVDEFDAAELIVADAWALPWIGGGNPGVISIWIDSDLASRTRKCVVSHLETTELSRSEAHALLSEKDTSTRDRFHRMYGFDLFTDRTPFAAVVDNTTLIPEATRASADAGIERFAPVISAVVRYASGDRTRAVSAAVRAGLEEGLVTHVREWPP